MHTYRKANGGWQVEHDDVAVGPTFAEECAAAAFASYLNGGRFSPGEIEHVFTAVPMADEDDDSPHPDRPPELDDYPLERRKA